MPHSASAECALEIEGMYKLVALPHPVLSRIASLGACELREELPTRAVLVSVRPSAPKDRIDAIRTEVRRAFPDRPVNVSIRALEPMARCSQTPGETRLAS